MVLYFIVCLFLCICAKRKSLITFGLVCATLFVITAFRGYTVGTDTLNYQMLFTGEAEVSKAGELGFTYIYMWLNNYGLSYRWFLITTAVLFWVPLFILSYLKEPNAPVFPLVFVFLLGYCFMFFNISRQMIAVSIGMWTFYLFEKKANYVWIILMILLASLFHTTAILLLMVFVVNKMKNNQFYYVVLIFFSFILPFVIDTNSIISPFLSRLGLEDRFSNYLTYSNKEAFSVNRLLMNFLFAFIVLRKEKVASDFYYKNLIFGLVVLNLFPSSSYVTRAGIIYLMSQIFFLPRYYKMGDNLDKCIVWMYSIAVFLSFVFNNNGGIVPYMFG